MSWNGRKEQSSPDLGESGLCVSIDMLEARLDGALDLVETRLDGGESGDHCEDKTILPFSRHLPAAPANN